MVSIKEEYTCVQMATSLTKFPRMLLEHWSFPHFATCSISYAFEILTQACVHLKITKCKVSLLMVVENKYYFYVVLTKDNIKAYKHYSRNGIYTKQWN